MARGRAWTAADDAVVRAAAAATFREGLTVVAGGSVERAARLADAAARLGRTVAAVQKRAERIGAASYPMYRSGRRRRK